MENIVNKEKNVFIINGGPATGKGTRCKILSEFFGIAHISTGAMLREISKTDAEIAGKMERGELISDKIVTALVRERIKQPDCENGFVLDGYPRTINQAKLLEQLLEELDIKISKVIQLEVSDEVVFKRILGRQECTACGKGYGMNKPAVEGICDDCGGNLVNRSDDTEETLKTRIEVYKKNSKYIFDYYTNIGLLKTLNSSDHPERIIDVATDKK